jgi:outer membrane protein W
MKKLSFLACAVLLSTSLFAQKPASDVKYSLEGNLNYNSATGFNWTAPNLRARYFINDHFAARVQLGLGSESDRTNFYETTPGTGTGFDIERTSGWSAQLGAEYHLTGTSRMSPYFTAGFGFGGNTISNKGENNDGFNYDPDVQYKSKFSESVLGVALGAGIDFYVYENLYLGLELGWGLSTTIDNGGSSESTTGGVTTKFEIEGAGSSTSMGTGAFNTAFRIGWRF